MEQLIKAALAAIQTEMQRLYWNKYQKEYDTPFLNIGDSYIDNTFEVHSYYWGDDENIQSLPNFKYKELSCYWYKHFQRDLVWEYKGVRYAYIPSEFLEEMLNDCFTSMRRYYKGVN